MTDTGMVPGLREFIEYSKLVIMRTVGHRQSRYSRLGPGVLLATAVLFPLLVSAGDFRISFLDQPSILQETCALLESVGVPEETARTFRRLVEW